MTSFKIIRTIYKSKVNYIPKLDFITWYRAPCGFEMYVVHFTYSNVYPEERCNTFMCTGYLYYYALLMHDVVTYTSI